MPSGGGYQTSQQQQQQQAQHGAVNGANGYISPQYGWYISMTPPTPPQFHDSSNSEANKNREGHQQKQYNTLQQQYQFHNTNGTNGFRTQNQQLLPPLQQQLLPPLQQQFQQNNNNMERHSDQVGTMKTRPVFTRSLKGVPNDTSGWPSVPL